MNSNVRDFRFKRIDNSINYYLVVMILHSIIESFNDDLCLYILDDPFRRGFSHTIIHEGNLTKIKLSFVMEDGATEDYDFFAEIREQINQTMVEYLSSLDPYLYDSLELGVMQKDVKEINPLQLRYIGVENADMYFEFAYANDENTAQYLLNEGRNSVYI